MANSSREALLHSAMDQLVSRVRKWKAGNDPVGPNQAQDLCHKHKDDIYKCFQESGLQAWEFHTMLHRAAEYGLVEDMKGLWSEVATTFLQMRSGSGYGSFDAQGQHMQPGFGQPQQQQAGPPGSAPKANGVYGAPYTPNGRSSNGSVAGTGNKPPGLNRQGQQGLAYAAAPAARSPQDDIAGTSTDQHSSRKQQQQQQQQAKPGSRSSSVGKGAAMQGGNQQQQGRGPAGKQQAAGTAAGAAAAGGKGAAAAPAGPAAAAAAPDAGGAMSNGYISAWRNGPNAASSKPGPSLMSGFMSGAGFQQQQLQQQQASMEPLQQGMDQQQQEEPLDLLPLGLLDDVYDQGDAVVDGPAKGKASGKPAAKQQAQQQGKQQQSAKPRGAQQQQQQQAQQQGRSQQQAPAAQQQPAQNSRSVSAPSASSHQQQQQQADALSAFEGVSVVGPLSPTARPFAPSLSVGPFSSQQQQQQQQQPQLGGFDVTSPLAGLQQRASMEALHQQQQQQQILMLQQQARYYQQQQMGMWGSSAPPMPYMHPLGAPGMPMQPPPPPRNSAAAAAAPGSSQPGAIAAAAAQQAPVKPGYAAVAAGLTAAQGSNSGSNALAAAPAGSSSDAGSSLGDMSRLSAGAPMSYRGSLGLSAALGGPVGHPAATDTDRRLLVNVVPGSAAQQQQQQQMQAPSGALGAESAAHSSVLSASSGPLQQQQGLLGMQQQPAAAGATAGGPGSSNGGKGLMPAGLSLFQGASYDSPLNGPLLGSSSTGAAVGAGPLSPYPSPMHRSLSGVPSGGASPALTSLAASGPQGSSSLGMAPMLLPPSALGAIGEPVGSHAHLQQQQSAPAAPRPAWGGAPGRAVAPPPPPAAAAEEQLQQDASAQSNSGTARQAGAVPTQQQQQEMQVGSLGSVGSGRGIVPDSSSSSASSSVAAPAAASVSSPHSIADSSPNTLGRTHAQPQQQQGAAPQTAADAAAVQQQSPQQRAQIDSTVAQRSPARQQQQQVPASPGKPLTWAQKLKKAEATGGPTPNSPASAAGAAGNGAGWGAAAGGAHPLVASGSSSGPRIAPAPKSELSAAGAAAGSTGGMSSRGMHKTTGQALLAAAKQQEEEAAAAAAAAVPTYSEAAALEGLDETTAKAAVTAASRMPLPAKLIQAWRSGMCLGSLIKLLQSQRPDLATAVNDRIKGWLCQDCDRSTAECLVLFVLANLRRDWHMTAKNPGAFLMGLLQHRAALIGGSGLSRKLLETARNFPNVAVYIDSDVLQELGDMEPELRGFVMDEYMCKQRHDWPEGLKFPSQCLLSCMRSIRYADPAVHRAYIQLLASRPDLSKACNGVILYGLCKCDKATGLAAVKRLSELPEAWTSAARVNASAFLYQKVQELCGGHGCY